MLVGNQHWVLFEGWGLKEPGLRLSDRGSTMGWQSYRNLIAFLSIFYWLDTV